MPTLRIFIALELNPEIHKTIESIQNILKKADADVKWVKHSQAHITLKFLGELSEDKLLELKKRLATIKAKKISATLSRIGVFPNEFVPHVLWAELEPEKEIISLAQKIDEETLDLAAGEQQFVSHLTLGRIKTITNKVSFKTYLKELKIEKIPGVLESFTLYQSTLSSQGPTYKEIQTYSLL